MEDQRVLGGQEDQVLNVTVWLRSNTYVMILINKIQLFLNFYKKIYISMELCEL